jgi:copper homeostasis protein
MSRRRAGAIRGIERCCLQRGKVIIYAVCVDSVAGVRAAKSAEADLVELSADLWEGCITPGPGMMRQARAAVGIGIHVMIRPRNGGFIFDDDEPRSSERTLKPLGVDGVVIGVLTLRTAK